MKLQLDTTAKTIKVEENVKLDELVKMLEKILPKEEWKKYTLQTNVIIERWSNPIYIREYPYYIYPWVTTSTYQVATLNSDKLTTGVYNIEG